jgi:hypothetical protein
MTTENKPAKKPVNTKSKYYIPPEKFRAEYALSQEKGEPTLKLLLMFEKIAKRYSTKFRCVNKLDTDACVNYALTEAWQKWDKYDETRSDNIFSFFTSMVKNDLAQHYKDITKNKSHISLDVLFSSGNN